MRLVPAASALMLSTSVANADTFNKKTKLSFSQPVRVPGVTLSAGTSKIPLIGGELGNVAIAGHRDTHFRPLRNIRTDVISLFDENSADKNPGVLKQLPRQTGGLAYLPEDLSTVNEFVHRLPKTSGTNTPWVIRRAR